MIPLDPNGYAVNPSTGTVHTRYVGEHGGQTQRTRTVKGVETLLDGRAAKACPTCYPSPTYPEAAKPRAPQKRRVPKKK